MLPGGTAYITDVGMTGPRGGVIGVKREQALERFITMMPVKFETSDEDPWLNGVAVEAGDDGLAAEIEQVLLPQIVHSPRPTVTTGPDSCLCLWSVD